MSFSSDWLSLREAFDHRSRAPIPRDRFIQWLSGQWLSGQSDPLLVDLGGGTGSTARSLAPFLQTPPDWLIIERDPALIAAGQALDARLAYEAGDLSGDLQALIPNHARAITASALIDLVSQSWLERLVDLAQVRAIPLYIALTYDGRMRWRPGDLFDPNLKRCFDEHQHGDKGFGPALGPDAPRALIELLGPLGGELIKAPSDWLIERDEPSLQLALLEGYQQAALEIAREKPSDISDWARARTARIEAGQSRHMVGHQDILWLPA